MSTTTTNYGLVKPELTDAADITMMNQNWDKIDQVMANSDNNQKWKSYSVLTQVSPSLTFDSTPFEVASAMPDYSVLCTPTGATISYNGGLIPVAEHGVLTIKKTTIARVTFEFIGEVTGCYYAYLRTNESTFSGWKQVYSEKDAKVVKKSGDTMTGQLRIKNNESATNGMRIGEASTTGAVLIDQSDIEDDTSDRSGLKVMNESDTLGEMAQLFRTVDGTTTWYPLYGEHNTHIGVKTYNALSDLGLTTGSETIKDIATNLPNNSMLAIGITTNNAEIYPSNYGLLTVKKPSNTRIEFEFVTTSGQVHKAFYSITSNGDSWSAWNKVWMATDILYSTTDLTAGTSTLATGKLYFVYE